MLNKAKIQNIINVILITAQCIVYCLFYNQIKAFTSVYIISSMALCLLTRAVVFKSDSSMFISFVLSDICVIMLLNVFVELNTDETIGYLITMFAFTSFVVALCFGKAVYYKIFILLAPIGVLCATYAQLYIPLWVMISSVVGYLIGYILILNLKEQ